MICLNTFVFIKLLDFKLLIKYALYIAANYMKVLTIPREKYFVAFLKFKIIFAKALFILPELRHIRCPAYIKDIN